MIKFKISSERAAEALNILEYLSISSGNAETAIRVAPRFILDDAGEYMVHVVIDDDGDITTFENVDKALLRMTAVTPKRLERLAKELTEAVKSIVDPTSGGGSKKPTSTTPEQPPPG